MYYFSFFEEFWNNLRLFIYDKWKIINKGFDFFKEEKTVTTKELTKDTVDLEIGIVVRVGDKFIHVEIGHDNIEMEEFDSYLDYILYDSNYKDIDGGQIDYSSEEINYENNPNLAIQEVLDSFEQELDTEEFVILSEDEIYDFFDKVNEIW